MKRLYLFPILILMACSAMDQTPKAAKADKQYEAYQFDPAAKAYENILKSDPANTATIVKLVNCYVKLGNTAKANYWLNKALKAPLTDAKLLRELAAMLASEARYEEASHFYKKAAAANDKESLKWHQAYQNMHDFYKDSTLYEVNRVSFNSAYSDFSPAFYKEGVVFSSARNNKIKSKFLDRNYLEFIDLFYASSDVSKPVIFNGALNSGYHEGPLSFNATQDTVFFTRSDLQQKSVAGRAGSVNKLKIYTAVLENDKWRNIEMFPLNSKDYSIGHPALANSHTLYFVSDMPGGYGGTDLYKTVKVNGRWQEPVNLGPKINTGGNEMFPYVDENNNLYFASNGHPGLGGLDIFYTTQEGEEFGTVSTMGFPINTPGDDFGLIIKEDAGYYSSNYNSIHDDIYAFKAKRK